MLPPPAADEVTMSTSFSKQRATGACRTLLCIALALSGCGNEPDSPAADSAAGTEDAAATDAVDVSAVDVGSPVDVAAPKDVAVDAGAPFDCAAGCGTFAVCDSVLPTTLCTALCQDVTVGAIVQKCLTSVGDCDSLVTCMSAAAEPPKEPLRKFDTGKEGYFYRSLAGDFTVPTLRGSWTFSDHYDGHSSYVFLTVGKGLYSKNGGGDYLTWLWGSATTADIGKLMEWSPDNAHYFFVPYRDADGTDNTAKYIEQMKARFDYHLAKLKPIDRLRWRNRLHFVNKPMSWTKYPNEGAYGWIGELLRKKPRAAFAIDRFQRLRQVGLLSVVGNNNKAYVHHLAWEARYYNYEWKRTEDHPETGDMKIVTLYDEKVVNGETFDFDMPAASELNKYDSVEVDFAQMCKNHDDTNCFEWDYHSHLKVVERPATEEEGKHVPASCQIAVGEVKEQDEVLGACQLAGKATDTTCKKHCDCEAKHGLGATCKGYKPARKAVAKVAADTKDCNCITPRQETVKRKRGCTWVTKPVTKTAGHCLLDKKHHYCKACNSDADCGGAKGSCKGAKVTVEGKTGWGKCGCKSNFIQRWITTYHREGRWITDSPRARHYLGNGGKVRFAFKGSYPYTTTLKLRFLNKNVPPPTGIQHLFAGGGYGANYNDKYKPIEVTVPKDAKKVELAVEVTGHGFGSKLNCAEFCNHTHHFTVGSDAGSKTYVKEHNWVGNFYGCAHQVDEGTVPNQFGTWYLGRGGWCPGKDVRVVTWDITDRVKPGETFTVSYKSLFQGKPEGKGGNIHMDSWVLFR